MFPTPGPELQWPLTQARLNANTAFWQTYIAARPTPTDFIFQYINAYHAEHGSHQHVVAHDVSTGPGNIAAHLARYYDHVLASDANASALMAARSLISEETRRQITFINCPAEDLRQQNTTMDLREGETDLVVVSQSLPLFSASRALRVFHSLLRPGGTFASLFYGRPIFVDGDSDECNTIFEEITTWICTLFHPIQHTSAYLTQARAAGTLASFFDNITIPPEDWEHVTRYKWNCNHPLLFNHEDGYDFQIVATDQRVGEPASIQTTNYNFGAERWDLARVRAFLDSIYPQYRQRAGDDLGDIEALLQDLGSAMGGAASRRKISFPVVLILATKR